VPILAGSDFGGSAWGVFGASLHQDFDLLAQAGISPLKILQTTTLNGAKFYNRQATAGSVEEGKEANLILLMEIRSLACRTRIRSTPSLEVESFVPMRAR
jgi:imidazolonepropionase-like amidohydrolase